MYCGLALRIKWTLAAAKLRAALVSWRKAVAADNRKNLP